MTGKRAEFDVEYVCKLGVAQIYVLRYMQRELTKVALFRHVSYTSFIIIRFPYLPRRTVLDSLKLVNTTLRRYGWVLSNGLDWIRGRLGSITLDYK